MGAPIIVCGKTEHIGRGVIAGLKPEYDVIHFVMTPESGAVQVPAILKGSQPPSSDSALGSKDYSRPPVAVILGGGFDDADFGVIRKAAEGIKPLPWLRADLAKPAPPVGPEYGKAIVVRVKELLSRLEKEGQMNEDKIHLY
ncbi:hypothetical protein F5B21DRAFT_508224 [Xylaria acuta]|nr:hypothetical protein F5B21DRAFT_508224 [Xylaria acuta]